VAETGKETVVEGGQVTDLALDEVRPLPPLAAKADDLDSLRAAVVDAAGVSGALWLSYLFVLFYFLVATAGITHKDLFLESPVRLPFLNVDLPLKGFFWLGPLIFLIVHAYVLLHFVVLAGKIRVFNRALVEQVVSPDTRAALRRQLPTSIFVQFLAGPREVRLGTVGVLLWLIAIISLLVGPVAVLLFFELQFLPYHDEWITWLQRAAVVGDLGLIWALWPLIAARAVDDRNAAAVGLTWSTALTPSPWLALPLIVSVLLAVFLPLVTTFRGETLDDMIPRTYVPLTGIAENVPLLTWLRKNLVEGEVDPASRRPVSLWSNRLVLPGLDVSSLRPGLVTASPRNRHLEAAVMIGAILRDVDFTGANLRWANLEKADLRNARFGCAKWLEDGSGMTREPICTHLESALLNEASLQGASLAGASLQGASLRGASLQGASLDSARLEGARLNGASLLGASLVGASLQGADLSWASLQATSLESARLQGAVLYNASLHGASLANASLQGATLDGTALLGASLVNASLQGASLSEASVWRATTRFHDSAWDEVPIGGMGPTKIPDSDVDFTTVRVAYLNSKAEYRCPSNGSEYAICRWTIRSFNDLRAAVGHEIPADSVRTDALRRVDQALNPDGAFPDEKANEAAWTERGTLTRSIADYQAERVNQLIKVGCDPNGAPYVMTALAGRLWAEFPEDPAIRGRVAAGFLEPGCKGARGIPANLIDVLRGLLPRRGAQTISAGP
jgi:uncharacterized protein YjbI with pentapeptide repeats